MNIITRVNSMSEEKATGWCRKFDYIWTASNDL